MKKLLISFAFAILFITGCVSDDASPKTVTQDFLQAMATGDAKTAVNLIGAAATNRALIEKNVRQKIEGGKKMLAEKGGVVSIECDEPEYNKDKTRALVKAKITYNNGKIDMAKLSLKKLESGWKVE